MGYFSKLNLLSKNCLGKFTINSVVVNSYPKKLLLLYQLIWIKTEYINYWPFFLKKFKKKKTKFLVKIKILKYFKTFYTI